MATSRRIVLPLLRRGKCPHCWAKFPAEEVLWIAAHADLLGDPKLGTHQPQRFLPTRFTVDGNALDARGAPCHALACPRCHLPLPRALVEMEPFFISILGTPGCGKSYYLTALTWELRRFLPVHFGLSFLEADTAANRSLTEYEEALFLNPRADELIPLADLIRKTELQGDMYDTVLHGQQSVNYPRPFLFTMMLQEHHPNSKLAHKLARVCCLYDNAGEHFLAGQESASIPVTQHLALAGLLLYLFDPTQDPRFRRLCEDRKLPTHGFPAGRASRQETVLLEAAQRIRRYTGLPLNAKHDRPLMVILTKWDAWMGLLQDRDIQDPWINDPVTKLARLDMDRIERRSQEIRSLLLQTTPEVIAAAEGFARQVIYVPVSALGVAPQPEPRSKKMAVRPKSIRPLWATVPFVYGLAQGIPGLFLRAQRTTLNPSPPPQRGPGTAGLHFPRRP